MPSVDKIRIAVSHARELISHDQCLYFREHENMHEMEPFYELIRMVNNDSSKDLVSVAISALSSISEYRYEQNKKNGCNMIYSTYFDMLSDYEKGELHRLKQTLPTFAEVRQSARSFILERCAARRQGITAL